MTGEHRYIVHLRVANGRWQDSRKTSCLERAKRAIAAEIASPSRDVTSGRIVDLVTNQIVHSTHGDDLRDLVQDCFAKATITTQWEFDEIYRDLTERDRLLSEEWLCRTDDYEKARMLSARGAEKAAMRFYEELGYHVDDVSSEQLDKVTDRYKRFDLLLDGRRCVDVKNARTSGGDRSHTRYVEHCIKRLKRHDGQEVTIAGVLSPYLQLQYIRGTRPGFPVCPIRFLGEVSKAEIERLEGSFAQDGLELVSVSQDVYPPWLFDYPQEFYRERDWGRAALGKAASGTLPQHLEWSGYSPVPAFLSSGVSLPEVWHRQLRNWELEFYSTVLERGQSGITLPTLFLSILAHFLGMLSYDVSDYSPQRYARLLYYDHRKPVHPLGIHDPLGVIRDLCSTLEDVWAHRESTKIGEFRRFRFDGRGLLLGKRKQNDQYETIIAYCGGSIEGKGKCGHYPLILGQEQLCPKCRRLICPACGYCSLGCR